MTKSESALRMSMFAESMARTLGEAVHGPMWPNLTTAQQSELRLICESIIRRCDPVVEKVARQAAHKRMVSACLNTRDWQALDTDVVAAFDLALQSYFLHLTHGPLAPAETEDPQKVSA